MKRWAHGVPNTAASRGSALHHRTVHHHTRMMHQSTGRAHSCTHCHPEIQGVTREQGRPGLHCALAEQHAATRVFCIILPWDSPDAA